MAPPRPLTGNPTTDTRRVRRLIAALAAGLVASGLQAAGAGMFAPSSITSPPAQPTPCAPTVRWEVYPPYGVAGPQGVPTGYYADVVAEALRRMGCTPRFVRTPWARGLRDVAEGRLDIMAGALRTPEREAFAWFSAPINLSPNLLFLQGRIAERYPLARLADLRDTRLRIGTEPKVHYGEEYGALLKDPAFVARLHVVPDRPRAWRMLRSGRLDGIIADQATAVVSGTDLPALGDTLVPVLVLSAEPAHVMLSRRSVDAAFVARFDAALADMRADGTLERLRERWIPCDTDPATMGCRIGAPIELPASIPDPVDGPPEAAALVGPPLR